MWRHEETCGDTRKHEETCGDMRKHEGGGKHRLMRHEEEPERKAEGSVCAARTNRSRAGALPVVLLGLLGVLLCLGVVVLAFML